MGTESRTRVTVETERVLIIGDGHAMRGRCERCGYEAEMWTVEKAAEPSLMFQLGRAKSELVVCLKSMIHLLQGRRRSS